MTGPWIAAFALLWIVVVAVAVLLLGTLRRVAAILERAEAQVTGGDSSAFAPGGLAAGTPVPDFSTTGPSGAPFTRADLLGEPTIVLFLSSDCPPCRLLAIDLADSDAADQLGVRVVAILDKPDEGTRLAERLSRSATVLYQHEKQLARAFASNATPHAFAIDERGVIAGRGTPNAHEGLLELAATLGREEHTTASTNKGPLREEVTF